MSWVAIFTSLHILGATIWVGGLFMLVAIIWPSINQTVINHQAYLKASVDVLGMFIPWLIAASIMTIISGYVTLFGLYHGFKSAPLYIHIMAGFGFFMLLLVGHIIMSPWKRMHKALEEKAWDEVEKYLPKAKLFVWIGLVIGVIVLLVAGSGRYWIIH